MHCILYRAEKAVSKCKMSVAFEAMAYWVRSDSQIIKPIKHLNKWF